MHILLALRVERPFTVCKTRSNRWLILILADAFSKRVQELGRPSPSINVQKLLPGNTRISPQTPPSEPIVWKAPARLESDQLIGIFFQEWAPLFPILHRPTFLELYQSYMAAPEKIVDNCSHAQLNLVFGIAALSGGVSHVDIAVASQY